MRQEEGTSKWGQWATQNGDGVHEYGGWEHPLSNGPARKRAMLTGRQVKGGQLKSSARRTDHRELLSGWSVAEGADIGTRKGPVPLVTTEAASPFAQAKREASDPPGHCLLGQRWPTSVAM